MPTRRFFGRVAPKTTLLVGAATSGEAVAEELTGVHTAETV